MGMGEEMNLFHNRRQAGIGSFAQIQYLNAYLLDMPGT